MFTRNSNSTLNWLRVQMVVLPIILALLITACSGAQPAVTEAPESSSTPNPPTATLPPTNTPTSIPTVAPTATPDITATAAAQATEMADSVYNELDMLLADSDVPYKEGHLLWQQTDPLVIDMQGPSGNKASILEIDESLAGSNFVFKSDVTWNATGWMYCGAVFRSEPNIQLGKQYQFYFLRFSGLPIWYLDVYQNGSDYLGSISGEQTSGAIDMANDATNQFVVVAEDEVFTVYFNGVRQGRYLDYSKQRMDGSFGFFAWQESGTGSCEFENSWIWSLEN